MMMSQKTWLLIGVLGVTGVACAAAPMPDSSPGNGLVAAGPKGPPANTTGDPLPADQKPEDTKKSDPEKSDKFGESKEEADMLAEGEHADRDDGIVVGPTKAIAAAPSPPPKPIAAAPRPTDPLASGGGSANARGGSPGGSDGAAQGESIEGGVYGGVVGEKKGGQKIGATSEVRGSIDREEIRRVVIAHVNEVQRCYEQGLKRQPGLEGRVVLKFLIGKTGTVTTVTVAQTTMNDRQVEQCMVGAATKWTFPKPKGEGDVTFVYPFVLKSAP